MKVTKSDIINLGSAAVGVILLNTAVPIVQTAGGFLFAGSVFVGLYRMWKKTKAEKKEVLF